MNAETSLILALATLTAGAGVAMAVANVPSDFLSYAPFLPVGPDVNACNDGNPDNHANPPQEYGWGSGNATSSSGTNYHRYANDNAINGIDDCNSLTGVSFFALCALGTETSAASDGAATALAGPLPGSAFAGANIIVTQTGNVVAGAACGGIAGSGTDGEYEYGSAAAFLNVRTGPGANGGDGLQGCYGGDCGANVVNGCLADDFTKGSAHHALDTHVVVMDAALGGIIGFTVASDWARPPSTSASGFDENKIPGQKHCGDGVVEPCINGVHAGLQNDLTRGDLTSPSNGNPGTFVTDAAWLTGNVPTNEPALDRWNQVRVGCNPIERTTVVPAQPLLSLAASNDWNSGTSLSNFGNAGYTGGAAGFLIVLLGYDNPGGVLHTHVYADTIPPTTTGVATAGWVWTY